MIGSLLAVYSIKVYHVFRKMGGENCLFHSPAAKHCGAELPLRNVVCIRLSRIKMHNKSTLKLSKFQNSGCLCFFEVSNSMVLIKRET